MSTSAHVQTMSKSKKPIVVQAAFSVDQEAAVMEEIFDIIVSVYNCKPDKYTLLATHGGVTYRTAYNWLARLNAPRLSQMLLLMRENKEVRRGMLAMIEKMTSLG